MAKRYGKQLDIIEAARQILAEQEQTERAKQEADPKHKVSVYDIRLAEDIYVIPAYAEPHCVIVSGRRIVSQERKNNRGDINAIGTCEYLL